MSRSCLTLDPQDGTQPDVERCDVTEDLNDILPLCTALVPAERPTYVDKAEAKAEACSGTSTDCAKITEWTRETPAHALLDLSSQIGGKVRWPVKVVQWSRIQQAGDLSSSPSIEAQLEVLSALARYFAHLDALRSTQVDAIDDDNDAVNEASEELNCSCSLRFTLNPKRLAQYYEQPLSAKFARRVAQNLLELNEQISRKAKHVVAGLKAYFTKEETSKGRSVAVPNPETYFAFP
ncbi:hypothetical protein K437DRAFT_266335 [Tilletiaria anomala UBC 951]|uniref:Uncharacterized protein n=1 Tax=Tilletiaria anomala (strain ATCC 24038 / CBS 436.72 / UBC 951) TaxID=1037660 RepID=A0A066WG20_TILAU|nr:uncharacterized protein K437DRAFT_266335 [Tilletiaria anomala UBC 951]KDN52897.1 hypothetical protein K437DRAFT_266335 [Tilletiaria anomala UBC 951]